jgi:Zn-dependent protease
MRLMFALRRGSIRLFRLFGIDVFLHWSWFLIAAFFLFVDNGLGSVGLQAALFVSLFAIVLLHEFGHALACRSVGGIARDIVLWPLGGIAFVQPPQRPGAVLWSVAAGPLVNLILVLPLGLAAWLVGGDAIAGGAVDVGSLPPLAAYLMLLSMVNLVLLVFNMLPIYPLDGGQILMAILWFFIGHARALKATAAVGIVAAVAGGVYALMNGEFILLLIAAFVGWQALKGFVSAKLMIAVQRQQERMRQAGPGGGPGGGPGAGPGAGPLGPMPWPGGLGHQPGQPPRKVVVNEAQ